MTETPKPSFDEYSSSVTDELRRVNTDLQRRLVRAKAKSEDLVAAAQQGALNAMTTFGPIPKVPKPEKDKRTHGEEVAFLHLTDWQGAKLTPSYNSEIMRDRVLQCTRKVEYITSIQRAHHPVRKLIIALGGDMGEGLFNFPTQPFEIDATIFGQYITVSRLLVDVVRWALSVYDTVEVIAEWGNHGRIGSKRSAVPRSDNFDRMIYELSRQLLAGEERLSWQDCPDDIQRIEVGEYRALLIHGDEIGRNGFASPTTIVKHVANWQSGAYRWAFRDCYIGHYHTHAEWPLPNGLGSVYQTGSTESDNRYAGVMLASQATPSQRLHYIDPIEGRVTSAYKLWLD